MPRFVDPIEMKSSPTAPGIVRTVIGTNGEIYQPVAAATGSTGTTGTPVPNYGTTMIQSTGGTRLYALATPVAGIHKTLFCTAGSTSNLAKVDAGAGVTFDGSRRYAVFNGVGDCLQLIGLSTTRWLVTSNVGAVAFSTS